MERCPVCRATLNGAEVCRRCRAELQSVLRVERRGQALMDAAIHRLSVNDFVAAEKLLRRATAINATPEVRILRHVVGEAAKFPLPVPWQRPVR